MLDIGWQELFIVAVFAILVIGPKDLPRALKTVMYWVRKMRSLAREFQSGVDEMVREADLDDVKKDLKKLSDAGDLKKTISDSIDPAGELSAIQKDLDTIARDATTEQPTPPEGEEENPFKNKSGDELRALIEKEKQKKATTEAAQEAARAEAEADSQEPVPTDTVDKTDTAPTKPGAEPGGGKSDT